MYSVKLWEVAIIFTSNPLGETEAVAAGLAFRGSNGAVDSMILVAQWLHRWFGFCVWRVVISHIFTGKVPPDPSDGRASYYGIFKGFLSQICFTETPPKGKVALP